MRLDDAPGVAFMPIDFGTVPAHFQLSLRVGNEVERENSYPTDLLYMGRNEFKPLGEDLSAERLVVIGQRLSPVESRWKKWVEIHNIFSANLEEPRGIPVTPANHGGAFNG
jgi:hypothetical protein